MKFLDKPSLSPMEGEIPGERLLDPEVPILAGGVQPGIFFCIGVEGDGEAGTGLDLKPMIGVDLVWF